MSRFARFFGAVGVALCVVAAWTAPDLRWDAAPWAAACFVGTAAVVVGLRRHRPRHRGFWVAIATANTLWGIGAVAQLVGAYDVASNAFGDGDVLYQPGYAALAVAVWMLLRTRRGGRPERTDIAIGGAIAVAVLWPLVVRLHHDVGTTAAVFGFVDAAVDLSLALALVRLALSKWVRLRSLQLVTGSALALTLTDISYSSLLFGSPIAARVMSVAYTVVYLLLGGAALAPSMRRMPPRDVRDHVRSNRRLLLILGVALAATPVSFGVVEALDGDRAGLLLATLTLFVVALVVVRISRLLRHLNELRVRAEESERLFRLVFDAAGIGISVGTDGVMSRTNAALHRILGFTAEELVGSHFTRFVHEDDRHIAHVPRPGSTYTFRRRYVRKDGETVWADVTLTAPEDNSFGIAVIDDVTEALQLEDDLRHAQKMEAVGQLAGGIAHDFNNLMMAVSGYAGLLERELPAEDARRERVDAIATAAGRATELTRKLLAFSRRQVLRLAPADLADVVTELEPILRGLLPETVVLDLDLERGAVARVDRGELEQVLLNLSLNARDAMESRGGGLLHIRVRDDAEAAELAVADTGTGMTEETRLRIFDPFFTTKPVGKGTGLGLSTVDGIVAQLGGTIEVESEPGRGTTFTIRLPRVAEAVVEPAPPPSDEPAARAGRVLLVEDEEIVRRVTTELLRRAGYDVVAAASAEDALLLLADGERPDVLVSDVVMTGIDGPTLVDRARELLPGLPVLFVSGYPAESLTDRTDEAILTKPFTPAELADGIEAVRRTALVA